MAIKGFLGQFDITIDDKGRVRIPAKYKAQLGEEFIISCSEEKCIAIYPAEKWEKMTEQVDSINMLDINANKFRRSIFTNVTQGSLDAAGRILIPVKYREYAGFKKELVAAGLGDYFEIWDTENWLEGQYSTLETRRTLQQEMADRISGGKNGI